MKRAGLTVFFVFYYAIVISQSIPVAGFSFPSDPYSVCLQQPLEITNSSTNVTEYLWDFCPETFTETLSQNGPFSVSTGLTNGWGYKVIKYQNEWVGFLVGNNTNKLYRLDFGTDPFATPIVTDLGNPGSLLVSPQGIDVVLQNGNWYAFIGKNSNSTGQMVRIDFGTDLKNNSPNALGLGLFGTTGRRFRDAKVVNQGSDWILLIILDADNAILRVNYRDSFNNTISAANISSTGALTNANLPAGLSVTRHQGNWIIHVVSIGNDAIQQYSFGSNILGSAVSQGNFVFSSLLNPYFVNVIREGDTYFAIIGNENRSLSIVNFGNLSGTPAPFQLSNTSFPRFIGVDVIKYESKNIIQGSLWGTNTFSQLQFENKSCSQSNSWSAEAEPNNIYFSSAGNYTIELLTHGANNQSDVASKSVSISALSAPSLSINNVGICKDSTVTFSVTSTSPLTSWNWDMGDSTNSLVSNPTHAYESTGTYIVKVVSAADNGCIGKATKSIKIYNQPIPDFNIPAGVICTNNDYEFENITPDVFDGHLIYKWKIDDQLIGTLRNLTISFPAAAENINIKLLASIPGCTEETYKTIPFVSEGPVVDFTFYGQCQSEGIAFNSKIIGDISLIEWDFGDSQFSSEEDPLHAYPSSGNYIVNLKTISLNGCQNSTSKSITIYTKPQPNFSIALPPFSCSGTPTQFNNTTPNPVDSNITQWAWNFADAGSPQNTSTQKNPQHIYLSAGDYNVSLTATSNYGCVNSLQKIITVSQSPTADFTNTPACKDQPIYFSDASTGTIQSWNWQIGNTSYYHSAPIHILTTEGNHTVNLTVTANNNCVSFINKFVNVPKPFLPAIKFEKDCVNQPTIFSDTTGLQADPIVMREWKFATLESGTGSPATFSFPAIGNYPVELKVTTASGCTYTNSRIVNITNAPQANFMATPEIGVPPLAVQFTNTSTHATKYLWDFNDGINSSTSVSSPAITFNNYGDYLVELTATNNKKCSNTYSKIISAVYPANDIALTSFLINGNNNGPAEMIVSLMNKGNLPAQNIKLLFELDGIELQQTVPGPIAPNASINHVASFGVVTNDRLKYVCATAEMPNDLYPNDNRLCTSFKNAVIIFEPYPNPSLGEITVEWISKNDQETTIAIFDALGHQKFVKTLSSNGGLNRNTLMLKNLVSGSYFMSVKTGDTHKLSRFVIAR